MKDMLDQIHPEKSASKLITCACIDTSKAGKARHILNFGLTARPSNTYSLALTTGKFVSVVYL